MRPVIELLETNLIAGIGSPPTACASRIVRFYMCCTQGGKRA